MRRSIQFVLTGLITTVFLACGDSTSPRQSKPGVGAPSFTLASGVTSTSVNRGSAGTFHIQTNTNGYHLEMNTQDSTDVVVATVSFDRSGSSGWHSHPGPVFAVVKSGSVTVYQVGSHGDEREGNDDHGDHGTCSGTVHPAGTAFVEPPGHIMNAVNEDKNNPAVVLATYVIPKGAAVRIDQPKPENCAF
jgi:hypothetical protein